MKYLKKDIIKPFILIGTFKNRLKLFKILTTFKQSYLMLKSSTDQYLQR